MYEVQYTAQAQEDLVSTMEYISSILKAPVVAESLLDEMEKEIGILAENPLLFPISQDEDIAKRGIRHMLIKNYFMSYSVDEELETVTIIRILHARRDWINLFRREPSNSLI